MYKVEFSESALKALKKLDKQTARVIKNWVIKHLVDCDDPRVHGKALKGNLAGIWRYRVGAVSYTHLDVYKRQEYVEATF